MSYGKIHRSFFDSSVNDVDPITRLVFIAMIVLSDRKGVLDLTAEALARRVNLDPKAVSAALEVLSRPDAASRTPDHDGRRIIPIDEHRAWGWVVVNKEQYRKSDDSDDDVRADARSRKRAQRRRDTENFSFSKEESKESKETHTLRDSHGRSPKRHVMSQEKRDAIFARCWELVPRKEGRKDALRHFDAEARKLLVAATTVVEAEAIVAKLEADITRAVRNYADSVRATDPRYVMQGSRLFFNFRDYMEKKSAQRAVDQREEGIKGVAL